jgi:hypothetical protein
LVKPPPISFPVPPKQFARHVEIAEPCSTSDSRSKRRCHEIRMQHDLMSKHPGVRGGPFEIRPVADMTPLIKESERRRSAAKK